MLTVHLVSGETLTIKTGTEIEEYPHTGWVKSELVNGDIVTINTAHVTHVVEEKQ